MQNTQVDKDMLSSPQVVGDTMEKLFPSWKWNCLPRPLVFSCQNVIKTAPKKNIKKIKENAIKIIKERRKRNQKGDTRRKYLISLPMDALKCHLLSCSLLPLLPFCCSLLPVILCYLPASYLLLWPSAPSLPCVVLCRLSSLYEL